MSKEELRLIDAEHDKLLAYAKQRGLSLEDAATELIKEAIAERFKKNLGRAPGRVYHMPAPAKKLHA